MQGRVGYASVLPRWIFVFNSLTCCVDFRLRYTIIYYCSVLATTTMTAILLCCQLSVCQLSELPWSAAFFRSQTTTKKLKWKIKWKKMREFITNAILICENDLLCQMTLPLPRSLCSAISAGACCSNLVECCTCGTIYLMRFFVVVSQVQLIFCGFLVVLWFCCGEFCKGNPQSFFFFVFVEKQYLPYGLAF